MTRVAVRPTADPGRALASRPHTPRARLTTVRPRGTNGKVEHALVDALGRRIVSGAWPPGALIPSEPALLADLGISRPTLRESLRVLASKGLIESRQKLGTFVRPINTWNFLDPALLSWLGSTKLTDQMVCEIIAFRRLIEPAVVAMAARGADANGIRGIADAFTAMTACQDDPIAYYDADRDFHQAIFDAAGNRFVASLGVVVAAVLDLSFSIQQISLLKPAEGLALHGAVSRAIGTGDARRAEQAMLNLLGEAESELAKAFDLVTSISQGRIVPAHEIGRCPARS